MATKDTVPEYLRDSGWLDFEQRTAVGSCRGLAHEMNNLRSKATSRRVHNTRVALRRFSAVWAVLKRDGWQSKDYKKRIGKPLKELRTLLGDLRDWDVSIEVGKRLGVSDGVLKRWGKERSTARQRVKAFLKDFEPDKVLSRLENFLQE